MAVRNVSGIKGLTPVEIADNVADLARVIQPESNANIMLSEIFARTDISNENIKANNLVNKYAKQNGWGRVICHKYYKSSYRSKSIASQ